jgi:hypothetical protein
MSAVRDPGAAGQPPARRPDRDTRTAAPSDGARPDAATERAGPDRADPDRAVPDRVTVERLDPRGVRALQVTAGNAAVSRLMAQRLREGPAAGAPKLDRARRTIEANRRRLTAHKPAAAEAGAAQKASKAPPDDKLAQAKVAQSGDMAAAKPGVFDKAKFIAAVGEVLAGQAPKNLDEADKFADRPSAPPPEVTSQVQQGKQQSTAAIAGATGKPPDESRAKVTPETPLTPDRPPGTPPGPNPADAVPDKAAPAATDFSGGPKQVTDQLSAVDVTPQQLRGKNEPAFDEAMDATDATVQHAAAAGPAVRAQEDRILTDARKHAATRGEAATAEAAGLRHQAGGQLDAGKNSAKDADQAAKAKVTGQLQKIFDACKSEVDQILQALDGKVNEQFTREEKAARDAFTADYTKRVDAYKDKRYSGLLGAGRWLKDKFAGLPDEVNQFYAQARTGYVNRMRTVVAPAIADTINTELTRATTRIATGRAQIDAAVKALPADQQAIGRQAAAGFTAQFDKLDAAVASKGEALFNDLKDRFAQALHAVDDQIEKEKEKNRGLVAKAMDAVAGVIKTILELKNLLLGILGKAVSAVMAILKDPIAFVGHFFSALGAGLRNFIANIGTHLNKGLVGWLLGTLAGAGLTLPTRFDLPGILLMVASLLGLTWSFIRGRIVSKGVPDQAVTAVEKSSPLVGEIKSGGPGAITKAVSSRVGDLKAGLMGKITAYLIPTVLMAGITWLLSLLTPASAFVKAAKAIVDLITFVITRGAQIVAFVNAVLDAVIAIAAGGAGPVPALIENALAVSIPVLIGVLAALLGISGIADKVKKFFQALTKPVMKAVDWLVTKITGLAKKLWAKLKSKFAGGTDNRSAADKQRAVDAAVAEAEQAMVPNATRAAVERRLPGIRRKHGLSELTLVETSPGMFHVHGSLNPQRDGSDHPLTTSDKVIRVGNRYVLKRDNIKGVDKIVGEPESVVEDDAAREAVAAELAASRGKIRRVFLGTEADAFVNAGTRGETSVDAVGVTKRGRFMLVEAKGGNIEHGLEQLADSAAQLGVDRVESYTLVVPEAIKAGLSGWRIQGYYLYQNDEPYLINGARVRVVRTSRGD